MDPQPIIAPNTCALLYNSADVENTLSYVGNVAEGATIFPGDTLNTAEQYENPEAALVGARALVPTFPADLILGYIPVDSTGGETSISVYEGSQVVLDGTVQSSDPTATFSYEWTNGVGLPILGQISSTFTFDSITQDLAGVYYCEAQATNPVGQTGGYTTRFEITVSPAIP